MEVFLRDNETWRRRQEGAHPVLCLSGRGGSDGGRWGDAAAWGSKPGYIGRDRGQDDARREEFSARHARGHAARAPRAPLPSASNCLFSACKKPTSGGGQRRAAGERLQSYYVLAGVACRVSAPTNASFWSRLQCPAPRLIRERRVTLGLLPAMGATRPSLCYVRMSL